MLDELNMCGGKPENCVIAELAIHFNISEKSVYELIFHSDVKDLMEKIIVDEDLK